MKDGDGTVQYDTGSGGSHATTRTFSITSEGLKIAYASATNAQYSAVSYIPDTPLDLSATPGLQIQLEVYFPPTMFYGNLNMFVVTQGGNTFTNYYNRSFGDSTAKFPNRQIINYNLSEMTATSGGADHSSIGKIHWRYVQTAAGATAGQPGEIYIRKVWAR
ncbi:MAG: hypothetical protein ACYTGQ_17230 [Planctomycetota bacterium]